MTEQIPFATAVPGTLRAWVSDLDAFSAIRDKSGVWSTTGFPSADDLNDNFEHVTDSTEASKLLQEARDVLAEGNVQPPIAGYELWKKKTIVGFLYRWETQDHEKLEKDLTEIIEEAHRMGIDG